MNFLKLLTEGDANCFSTSSNKTKSDKEPEPTSRDYKREKVHILKAKILSYTVSSKLSSVKNFAKINIRHLKFSSFHYNPCTIEYEGRWIILSNKNLIKSTKFLTKDNLELYFNTFRIR